MPASAPSALDFSSAISVAVTPNARCLLHPEGTTNDSTRLATAYAADEGVVRFLPPPESWGRVVTVDCQNADGTGASYRVDLNDASTFFRESSLLRPAPVARVRPPLTGDPLAPTQAELRQAGYPMRPDPIAQPERYQHWLKIVSHEVQEVAPRLVTHPGTNGGPYWQDVSSPNWGGPIVLSLPSYDFTTASVSFNVPTFSSEPGSQTLIWGGIGGGSAVLSGYSDPGLIQDGVLLSGNAASVFYEYAPYGWMLDSAITVNQGDPIWAECYSSDQYGNVLPPPAPYATYYVLDEGTWQATRTNPPFTLAAPIVINSSGEGYHSSATNGYTFEYIVERPDNPPNQPPLLDYGSMWMMGEGYDTTGKGHDITTDYYDYAYVHGVEDNNLLENNYQPGENKNSPSDEWVFWQWYNAE